MRNRILAGLILLCGHKRRDLQAGVAGAAERILQVSGQRDPEDRSALERAFHHNLAAVILNDFLYYRQSQSSAVLLAVADKRMKQALLDGLGNAGTVAGDVDGRPERIGGWSLRRWRMRGSEIRGCGRIRARNR